MTQKSKNKGITPAIRAQHAADQRTVMGVLSKYLADRSITWRQGLVWLFTMTMCFFLPTRALAEDQARVNPYSGDLWKRSTLTGDWGGLRNDLSNKGVSFDLSVTQILQGVVGGGKEAGWEYGGRGNLTLNMDTQKMGLWPGGFFTVEVEGNFGNDVNSQTGALIPVNTNQIFPMPGNDHLNIPAVNFTQFLSEYFGVLVGKLDTTSSDMNEFAHGKGDIQFFNTAFNITPVALMAAPSSTLGAGVIILPTKDPNGAIISLVAIDTNGQADRAGFDTLSVHNTTYAAEGRVKTNFFGLTGHQLAGYMYSTKDFASLDQRMRFVIDNGGFEKRSETWAFYYNFDQYIYEPKKGSGQGIGIFGRFGASDGNPNPVHYFYSVGIGGKGIMASRPHDRFGLGWYYIDIKNPTFTGPFTTRLFLSDEQGVEAYYSVALTPWAHLTPNIQVIRGAQEHRVAALPANRTNIDTATILGLRLQLLL
jgi:porin